MTDDDQDDAGLWPRIYDPSFVPSGDAYVRYDPSSLPRPPKKPNPAWYQFDPEKAVIEMLAAGVVTIEPIRTAEGALATGVFINCSDTFYWGGADAQLLPVARLRETYDLFKSGAPYALDKLCCRLRNLQPQIPLKEQMKEKGAWEAWLDDLPEPKDHPNDPD